MTIAIPPPRATLHPQAISPPATIATRPAYSSKLLATACASLAALSMSASAVSFDFYKLGRGAGDFLPDGVAGTDYFVVAGDNVSSSLATAANYNGNLKFTIGGLTATGHRHVYRSQHREFKTSPSGCRSR
jgi:hypothetical protein